jgi:hypothetical protein
MGTTPIIIIAILACIIVAAFLMHRSRAKVKLKGPGVRLPITQNLWRMLNASF